MSRHNKHPRYLSVVLSIILIFASIISTTSVEASSYQGKYWLKVNDKQNVVTAYVRSNGKWKPVRAMRCSTGSKGSTPKGTFYLKSRWNWGALVGNVYGQYCIHITSDILFHSVPYKKSKNKASQPTSEFNSLGKSVSHGCVRLSTMDAKWIYDKCPRGTKVTIYRSDNPGPLGKPAKINTTTKRKTYWDPTDPDKNNPNYKLKKPIINISEKKVQSVAYGSKYNLCSYVTAYDPNTTMNLTSLVKVYKVRKYSQKSDSYVSAKFSTTSPGIYKVTYSVKDPYSGNSYTTIKVVVEEKPTIDNPESKEDSY